MKILVVHNKYKEKGGEDNSFAIECAMLRSHGHRVETLVYENTEINSVSSVFKLSFQLFYNRKSAEDIQRKIDEFDPDIIHVHNFFYVVSPSVFFVARKNRIPVLFTVRNYRLICSGSLLLRDNKVCELCIKQKFPVHGVLHKCHRDSYVQTAHLTLVTGFHKLINTWGTKINKVIVLTDFAKRKLLSSGLHLKEEQIAVKPNFSDDLGYSHFNEREDFFLFVGRLSKEKGIDILLKALSIRKFNLKVIGTGPLLEEVKKYAQKHPNLEYLGFQENGFIIDLLKRSKALLFPSTWYEGMPRTILEAFSTGTPVISTDLDNINEIVTDNYNGVHFRNGDAQALADKISYFEQMPDQRRLYENARRTFEEKYTYQTNYRQLMAIYNELLGRPQKEHAEGVLVT